MLKMNKRQYKTNRSYKKGFDDGRFDGVKEGIRHMKNEVVALEKENAELQADIIVEKQIAEEQKQIAEERGARLDDMKKRADLHKKRIDNLSERVDNIDTEVQELTDEFNENCNTIKGLMQENDVLTERNDALIKDLIVLRDNPIYTDDLREYFAEGRRKWVNERIENNKTINRNQKQFSKLQKKNVGINSRINSKKIKHYDAMKELCDEIRAL